MRPVFPVLFIAIFILVLASCGGKDKKSSTPDANAAAKDTTGAVNSMQPIIGTVDSTLAPLKSFIEKGLDRWARSFRGFHIDSFRLTQTSPFSDSEYEGEPDLSKFYELYKPSLSFSPDSSFFIDLYSSGIMLEKKGKKIIASADVDQAITLCNLKTKAWKQIAFFGPSAGIEEAIWVSPAEFILAGMLVNDNGETLPIIMVGDTGNRVFRWFESNSVRPKSANYEASSMTKLKIDEWE